MVILIAAIFIIGIIAFQIYLRPPLKVEINEVIEAWAQQHNYKVLKVEGEAEWRSPFTNELSRWKEAYFLKVTVQNNNAGQRVAHLFMQQDSSGLKDFFSPLRLQGFTFEDEIDLRELKIKCITYWGKQVLVLILILLVTYLAERFDNNS